MSIPWDRLVVRDTTDEQTMVDVVERKYHVPKVAMQVVYSVVDLGCHAGYTLLHYAEMFPKARILGVDISGYNVEVARENVSIAGLDDRISIVHAGVGAYPGWCDFTDGASNTHKLVMGGAIQMLTMHHILDMAHGKVVDFVKFDIEGMEKLIFKQDGWSYRVSKLKAELHDDYTVDIATEDLTKRGFTVMVDPSHPACVEAWH